MVAFGRVGEVGARGVFVCGPRPAWIMAGRERLRLHPQVCDGPITAFAPLHNVICRHSFVEATAEGHLKICQLPPLSFDNNWPVQKIPLKATPHLITYSTDAKLYFLITSVPVEKPLSQVLQPERESEPSPQRPLDERAAEGAIDGDAGPTVRIDEYSLQVVTPPSADAPHGEWTVEEAARFLPAESGLTMKLLNIKNRTTGDASPLLAVGTAFVQGEDVACKGRIQLYEVGEEGPEAKPNGTHRQLREVLSRDLKGAVSSVAAVGGHLVAAVGRQLIVYTWTGAELEAISFFDAPLHCVSLNTVKNFLLLGDVGKSVQFLQWKEEGAQLALLGKDFHPLPTLATDFLMDGGTLGLLASDYNRNLQIFQYAPKSLESFKGQKLLPRAEFHTGAHIARFLRLQMLPPPEGTSGKAPANRYAALCATLEGGIVQLAPLNELTFRRLQALQGKLVEAVPHPAGLNPRSFRQFRSEGEPRRTGPTNIVDCELLSSFEMLEVGKQFELARQIGTTRSTILENLRDLALTTSFV